MTNCNPTATIPKRCRSLYNLLNLFECSIKYLIITKINHNSTNGNQVWTKPDGGGFIYFTVEKWEGTRNHTAIRQKDVN